MRALLLPLVLALTSSAVAAPTTAEDRDQARLAQLLAGRQPGKPRTCIPNLRNTNIRQFRPATLVYEGPNGTLYRTDAVSGCNGLGRGHALITRSTINQACSGDIVQVRDLQSGFDYGACTFGDFTPYERVTRRR